MAQRQIKKPDLRNLEWKTNNIGSKLLNAMGWKDGAAVGKRHRDSNDNVNMQFSSTTSSLSDAQQVGCNEMDQNNNNTDTTSYDKNATTVLVAGNDTMDTAVTSEGLWITKRRTGVGIGAESYSALREISTKHNHVADFASVLSSLQVKHSKLSSSSKKTDKATKKKNDKKKRKQDNNTIADNMNMEVTAAQANKIKKSSKKTTKEGTKKRKRERVDGDRNGSGSNTSSSIGKKKRNRENVGGDSNCSGNNAAAVASSFTTVHIKSVATNKITNAKVRRSKFQKLSPEDMNSIFAIQGGVGSG